MSDPKNTLYIKEDSPAVKRAKAAFLSAPKVEVSSIFARSPETYKEQARLICRLYSKGPLVTNLAPPFYTVPGRKPYGLLGASLVTLTVWARLSNYIYNKLNYLPREYEVYSRRRRAKRAFLKTPVTSEKSPLANLY
jgi:hypothetical protein